MQPPELLAPAGNLEKLKFAVLYGADAVYLGGQGYGLRQGADNFTLEELKRGISFAHQHGVRIYLTLNIFPHNRHLSGIRSYLKELRDLEIDGVIISDPGLIKAVKGILPGVELHLSTQANTVNQAAALFWEKQGFDRIILGRELSYKEIAEIAERTELGLEVFVHGALCIGYSGRCLLSSYLAQRQSNLGDCAHACRWKYHLLEEERPGEYHPVFEDQGGTYIFNSRDLCLIKELPRLMSLQLSALKIEGRMKSLHYVATVTRVYRQAIDSYIQDPEGYNFNPEWMQELKKVSHRDYTTGFFLGPPDSQAQRYESSSYIRSHDFLGIVHGYDSEGGQVEVEVRNKFFLGDWVEIIGPVMGPLEVTLHEIRDSEGRKLEDAPHPHQRIHFKVPQPVEPYSLVRRRKE